MLRVDRHGILQKTTFSYSTGENNHKKVPPPHFSFFFVEKRKNMFPCLVFQVFSFTCFFATETSKKKLNHFVASKISFYQVRRLNQISKFVSCASFFSFWLCSFMQTEVTFQIFTIKFSISLVHLFLLHFKFLCFFSNCWSKWPDLGRSNFRGVASKGKLCRRSLVKASSDAWVRRKKKGLKYIPYVF